MGGEESRRVGRYGARAGKWPPFPAVHGLLVPGARFPMVGVYRKRRLIVIACGH